MQNFLGFIHGADYLVNYFLIGAIFFHFLIVPAGGKEAEAIGKNGRKNIVFLLGLGFISSFLWMILSVHDMTESWVFESLWAGMSETSFAHIWCLKLAASLFLFGSVRLFWELKYNHYIILFFAVISPFAYVLTSHAAVQEDYTAIRMVLDWGHSLGVGVWTGGLFSLFQWLTQRIQSVEKIDSKISFQVVARFSHFAMASTFVIAVSGLVMAWLNGVSLQKPWDSDYGILVLFKVLFFTLILVAAAVNQFLHLRSWNEKNETEFVRKIRRDVGFEIVLLFVVFILAGFLTRTALPGG